MTSPASTPDFAAGQLWRCTGRTPDENPTVLINRVDQHPLGGEIFHVSLDGVRVKNPNLPTGVMTSLPHIPLVRQTLNLSAATFVRLQEPNPAYLPGYEQWKRAFDAGNAGSFGVSVAEILNFVERSLAGSR